LNWEIFAIFFGQYHKKIIPKKNLRYVYKKYKFYKEFKLFK
jgi:hypothetical protein